MPWLLEYELEVPLEMIRVDSKQTPVENTVGLRLLVGSSILPVSWKTQGISNVLDDFFGASLTNPLVITARVLRVTQLTKF